MVFFHWNGNNFPQFLHLANDEGYHREVKSSRWRIEVKNQFKLVSDVYTQLELIKVDFYELSGFPDHRIKPTNLLENVNFGIKTKKSLRFKP